MGQGKLTKANWGAMKHEHPEEYWAIIEETKERRKNKTALRRLRGEVVAERYAGRSIFEEYPELAKVRRDIIENEKVIRMIERCHGYFRKIY